MHGGAIKPLYQRARELRNNATYAEQVLWGFLKTKPFGLKFRRQHPYSIYILDFYCHSLKLIIEVDGSIHKLKEVIVNDEERQRNLEKDGLKVVRFKNDELLHTPEKIFEQIYMLLQNMIDDKKR